MNVLQWAWFKACTLCVDWLRQVAMSRLLRDVTTSGGQQQSSSVITAATNISINQPTSAPAAAADALLTHFISSTELDIARFDRFMA